MIKLMKNYEEIEERLDSGVWTLFKDMYADGYFQHKGIEFYLVEAREKDAIGMFMDETKCDPTRTTCKCCGQHFSILEYDSVFQATGSERNCRYDKELDLFIEEQDVSGSLLKYKSLKEFLSQQNVLIIFKDGSTDKHIEWQSIGKESA